MELQFTFAEGLPAGQILLAAYSVNKVSLAHSHTNVCTLPWKTCARNAENIGYLALFRKSLPTPELLCAGPLSKSFGYIHPVTPQLPWEVGHEAQQGSEMDPGHTAQVE